MCDLSLQISNISKLKDFLLQHRKDYVNAGGSVSFCSMNLQPLGHRAPQESLSEQDLCLDHSEGLSSCVCVCVFTV